MMLPAMALLLFFRAAEEDTLSGSGFAKASESKDCQMNRVRSDHDESASNEGHGP
jgi:hypothetical protein